MKSVVLVSGFFLYLNPFHSSISQVKQSSRWEPDKQMDLRESLANAVAVCSPAHVTEGIIINDTTNGKKKETKRLFEQDRSSKAKTRCLTVNPLLNTTGAFVLAPDGCFVFRVHYMEHVTLT